MMKIRHLLVLVCLSAIFIFSNFTTDTRSSFVLTVVNEEPMLPEIPFDYENIDFPQHLLEEIDSTFTGYEGGGIDSTAFDHITNDAATLGRVLFYDEKLSALENISCGSCHDQSLSFTENKDFSEGLSSLTKRNSMHLNDLGWTNDTHFSWGMEPTSLVDMIVLPLTDENEIGANLLEIGAKLASTSYYPDLFAAAYGDSDITEERIIDALAQFIESMVTFDSKLDQGAANNFQDFTNEELLGLELFSANCSVCHAQGNELSEFGFEPGMIFGSALEIFPFIFNNGLPEDTEDAGAGEWNEGFKGLYKIPTLRNIELTAPYMHDGRFTTLEEVVEHYSEEVEDNEWSVFLHSPGLKFDEESKKALVAFLKTLTDKSFLTNEKWSNPFALNAVDNLGDTFQDIVLKPNPMTDRAAIEFKNDLDRLVSINVLSGDGQLIRHDKITSNVYHINKDDFEPGIYFIQLIMDDAKSTQKLIVQ